MNGLNRICFLKITSWVGTTAIGAKHYYGRLTFGKEQYEVRKRLSRAEAKELNEEDDSPRCYKVGGLSGRFVDRQELIDIATIKYKQVFPDALALCLGESYRLEPQEILDGPPDYKEKVNFWYKKAESIDWWERNEKEMDKLVKEWEDYINAY